MSLDIGMPNEAASGWGEAGLGDRAERGNAKRQSLDKKMGKLFANRC